MKKRRSSPKKNKKHRSKSPKLGMRKSLSNSTTKTVKYAEEKKRGSFSFASKQRNEVVHRQRKSDSYLDRTRNAMIVLSDCFDDVDVNEVHQLSPFCSLNVSRDVLVKRMLREMIFFNVGIWKNCFYVSHFIDWIMPEYALDINQSIFMIKKMVSSRQFLPVDINYEINYGCKTCFLLNDVQEQVAVNGEVWGFRARDPVTVSIELLTRLLSIFSKWEESGFDENNRIEIINGQKFSSFLDILPELRKARLFDIKFIIDIQLFFINTYHVMLLHCVLAGVQIYSAHDFCINGSQFCYNIDGYNFSLCDIYFSVLLRNHELPKYVTKYYKRFRKNDPRNIGDMGESNQQILLLLSCTSRSSACIVVYDRDNFFVESEYIKKMTSKSFPNVDEIKLGYIFTKEWEFDVNYMLNFGSFDIIVDYEAESERKRKILLFKDNYLERSIEDIMEHYSVDESIPWLDYIFKELNCEKVLITEKLFLQTVHTDIIDHLISRIGNQEENIADFYSEYSPQVYCSFITYFLELTPTTIFGELSTPLLNIFTHIRNSEKHVFANLKTDKRLLAHFKWHLKKSNCFENFECNSLILIYKESPESELEDLAEKIISKFFQGDNEVNMSDKVRIQVLGAELNHSKFDQLEQTLTKTMKNDSFRKFLKSEEYQNYVKESVPQNKLEEVIAEVVEIFEKLPSHRYSIVEKLFTLFNDVIEHPENKVSYSLLSRAVALPLFHCDEEITSARVCFQLILTEWERFRRRT